MSNMGIYDIDEAIMACVDPDTGEIIDTERLDYLSIERDAKIENVGLWIKNLKAESDAIKAEIQNLQKRKKTADNKAEGLKNYLEYVLDGAKFKTPRLSVSYRKSESINITDLGQIGSDYLTYPEPIPMKTEIKKALKEGKDIKGVELVTKTNIQIK